MPGQAVAYVGTQVGVPAEEYLRYDWLGRAIKYHRARVRAHFGFREATVEDGEDLAAWLSEKVLPREQDADAMREAFYDKCRELKLEPPSEGRVGRLLAPARGRFEAGFFSSVFAALPDGTIVGLDALLTSGDEGDGASDDGGSTALWDRRRSVVGWLKADPGRVGLESALEEVEKLRRVREIGVPEGLFNGLSPKVLKAYRQRAATERPGELGAHPPEVRATLLAVLLDRE